MLFGLEASLSNKYHKKGFLLISTMGLGNELVNGLSLVPKPPQRITA